MTGRPTWPVLGVSVAVFRSTEALIIKRGREPLVGKWSLPGGRLEAGERLAEAVARELMEETGVTASLVGLNDIIEPITRDAEGQVVSHYVIASYVARHLTGDGVAGDDAADIAWIAPDAITRFETTPGLPSLLARAARLAEAG
ncbi:MAG: NUDIX hydrolase [Pseudomonadota bacterium]